MNKERRSDLSQIWDELNKEKEYRCGKIDTALSTLVDEMVLAKESIESIRDRIQDVLDGEQEAFDNMPEGLQGGEKGEAMTEAINYMEESITKLDEVIERIDINMSDYDIESDCQESLDAIDNAKGES